MLSLEVYGPITRHESQNAQAQQVLLVVKNINHHYVGTVTREAILFIPKDYGSIPQPFSYGGTDTKRGPGGGQFYRVSVSKVLVRCTISIKIIKTMPQPVPSGRAVQGVGLRPLAY